MPRPVGTVPFVQYPADFKIGEPVEIYIDGELSSCMRLKDFRVMHATATKRLAAYDAKTAEVVTLADRPRRRFKSEGGGKH